MSAALFVDGAYASIALRRYGCVVDVVGLAGWAEQVGGPLLVRYWFDATVDGMPNRFHSAARACGFRTKIHPTTPREPSGRRKQIGVDVGLAVHAMRSSRFDGWDTLVLVAGDGDFFPLAEYLVEQCGTKLVVLGEAKSSSPMLTSYASQRYEIADVLSAISRPPVA